MKFAELRGGTLTVAVVIAPALVPTELLCHEENGRFSKDPRKGPEVSTIEALEKM